VKLTAKILFALCCVCGGGVHAQSFANLNFENATLITDPSQGVPFVYATNAIPGWMAYINGAAQTSIVYDSVSTGAASVDLEGTNNGYFNPIQGNFFIYLQPSTGGSPQTAGIGQTGTIPVSAESLIFWGNYNGLITFNSQTLNYSETGSTANYNIYDADVSSFAGQTGQLLFLATPGAFPGSGTGGLIDNIQFSANPVPEPGGLALAALGGLCLIGCRRPKPFASSP
jgi:hypothetical protein